MMSFLNITKATGNLNFKDTSFLFENRYTDFCLIWSYVPIFQIRGDQGILQKGISSIESWRVLPVGRQRPLLRDLPQRVLVKLHVPGLGLPHGRDVRTKLEGVEEGLPAQNFKRYSDSRLNSCRRKLYIFKLAKFHFNLLICAGCVTLYSFK